jgi:hypothetical protein
MEYLKFGGKKDLDELVNKKAEKKNITEKLETEDIKIGDTVESIPTGRTGKVTGILADGRTVEVEIEGGNKQNLSKESLYIMKGDKIKSKAGNGSVKPYGDIDPLKKGNKDIEDIKQETEKVELPRESSVSKSKTPEQTPGKEVKAV